jgi:hypothetical protein
MALSRHPSLQTGRADLPHPAFQSVGSRARGSGSSPRPQVWRRDLRCQPSQWRLAVAAADQPLRALASVLGPSLSPSSFHLPASLRSTVVTRFFATTDALTPASQRGGLFTHGLHQHWRVSLITVKGSSDHSVSNHLRVVRGPPGCPAVRLFALCPLCRLRLSLADSPTHADRIEFTATIHPDSLCYGLVVLVPLLSTPHCCDAVTVRYRTVLHRTGTDSHRSIPSPSQAHERGRFARKFRLSRPKLTS